MGQQFPSVRIDFPSFSLLTSRYEIQCEDMVGGVYVDL